MKVLLKPFMLKKNILRLLILFLKNIIIFFDEDYDVNLNIGNNNNNNNNNQYIPPHYNWYLMYQLSRILIQHGNNLNGNLDGNENMCIFIIIGFSLIFISYYISNGDENGDKEIEINE